MLVPGIRFEVLQQTVSKVQPFPIENAFLSSLVFPHVCSMSVPTLGFKSDSKFDFQPPFSVNIFC